MLSLDMNSGMKTVYLPTKTELECALMKHSLMSGEIIFVGCIWFHSYITFEYCLHIFLEFIYSWYTFFLFFFILLKADVTFKIDSPIFLWLKGVKPYPCLMTDTATLLLYPLHHTWAIPLRPFL